MADTKLQNSPPDITTQSTNAKRFEQFTARLDSELLNHRVITSNPYTPWFASGEVSERQLKAFIVQFSVFSNQFLVAQLLKMLNAGSLEEMRASKEILANEIGIAFNDPQARKSGNQSDEEKNFGAITGSVEGGRFHFRAAHFELLLRCAQSIGLEFCDLGKRQLGSDKTLFFCDELQRLYGNGEYQIATASSFAVEHWAAAGFWQELEDGLEVLKQSPKYKNMPTIFFSWHNKLEANHAHHTQQELKEYYLNNSVDENAFIAVGNEMLDAVYTFWDGLNEQRLEIDKH